MLCCSVVIALACRICQGNNLESKFFAKGARGSFVMDVEFPDTSVK